MSTLRKQIESLKAEIDEERRLKMQAKLAASRVEAALTDLRNEHLRLMDNNAALVEDATLARGEMAATERTLNRVLDKIMKGEPK